MMRKISNEELSRLSVDEFKSTDKMPLVVVLDSVRSSISYLGCLTGEKDLLMRDYSHPSRSGDS